VKALIFGGGPAQEELPVDLKNRLINQNIESIKQIEQLVQKPISELWGINKR
jgi:hypothetical protein